MRFIKENKKEAITFKSLKEGDIFKTPSSENIYIVISPLCDNYGETYNAIDLNGGICDYAYEDTKVIPLKNVELHYSE